MSVRNTAWMDQALCAQIDTEIFFPGKGERADAAARICATCPVRRECADYALAEFNQATDHGLWGGTTPRDRRSTRNAA